MVTRPNYLAAQAWGIRPKSAKRRRRALICLMGPAAFYLGLLALAVLTQFILNLDNHDLHLDRYAHALFAISWIGGFVICTILPFRREKKFGNARMLQANYHDYRLALLTGSEILEGLAAPQLAGIKLFTIVYLFTFVPVACMWITLNSDYPLVLVAAVIYVGASIFNLHVSSRFNIAHWALSPKLATRTIKTAGMVFSCPITLSTICPPLVIVAITLLPLIFASYAVRLTKMTEAWSKARSILDGNEEVSLWVPVPDPPETNPEPAPSLRNMP